ncbi:Stp1/IreP family PP2C-type Ser/Thr phosphatase [Pseudobacteriovorax antillogorgiicola]|uniref:Protein phosphatase n=1 Tax=Pseudobacteriovorax antillogorgiicola TaxID=1513793 RepID=A0A1Y6B431_9BACT|nr:Stp1/IreP family PP2C-type Ser/Thr phosphatase [Pseudobacteriovorax antillogorgiicola]TCS59192.1 protein phosphatase [Pseudobacteriovorax antillogorgiicola]SME90726.1 protein phosphatase [Pseudobacteriovorax antillogorgiicola]
MRIKRVKGVGATDVGRVRSTNQDSFLVNNELGLFIVADGMGGHAGGEIASRICVERIQQWVQDKKAEMEKAERHPDPKIMTSLANSVNFASAKIYEHSLEDPTLRGMGTTATAVKIFNNYAYFAHVGDSRLYLVRKGFIYQITFDHSLVNEQVRAGILTPEEAEVHHLKNVITRSVGYQEEEDVDASCLALESDDYLLLCSDGLHGKISDAELSNAVSRNGLNSVNSMVRLANERGGEDNITALVVEIE